MTNIEWTERTWNIITGCTKCSEGCQNCYAAMFHKRLAGMGTAKYQQPFSKVTFHNGELSRVLDKNTMVFVNSMSDTFHEHIQDYEINRILAACENRILNKFQILTKRAQRLPDFKYPTNVWLGVTVESAKHKDRIKYLKRTNAKIKFLSCEPLIEDLGVLDLSGINWVIAGGESGLFARPMHIQWLRNILEQCREQNVPFFFKQWGTWAPFKGSALVKGVHIFKRDYAAGETPPVNNENIYYKIGKKHSGCLLDGKEYKEYPEEQ